MNPRKPEKTPVSSAPAKKTPVSSAPAASDFFVWPQGLKRTKSRKAVMAALGKENLPVTALYLFEKLQQGEEPIWLSTVYRVLESFVEKNAVIRNIPTDSTMAVYEWNRHTHMHYAVCVNCHSMVPLRDCPFEHVIPPIADGDFHIVGHNLELYGYCDKCYRKKEDDRQSH